MLSGKVVVVTGGAGLIGREFICGVAEKGGISVIADIDCIAANILLKSIDAKNFRNQVIFEQTDITSSDSLLRTIDTLNGRFGRIDALINNAYPRNKNYGRRLEEVTYGDFCENIAIHLGGYFLASQKFAAYFKEQGHGSIINMASVYGAIAPRFSIYEGTAITMPVEYAAIKSAVIHLTKYFAQYYKCSNIRVNSISPGGVRDKQPTEFQARYDQLGSSKGMIDAKDLVGTLLFLLSDMSSCINGQNIIVDDGWSL